LTNVVDREVVSERPNALELAQLRGWHTEYGLVAGITTRNGAAGDFNLGLGSGEKSEAVAGRWQELICAFATEFPGVTVSRQSHGTEVRHHASPFTGWLVMDGYDGHITREAGILLTVMVADCVPVYLTDPTTGGIALLHAGWRGIVAGVLERGIDRLAALTGSPPARFVMHCGVSISGPHYEVGPEVAERLGLPSSGSSEHVDLHDVLASRARAAGLERVTVSPWCTFRDSQYFFSHRRDGQAAGRMIAYLGRPLT
jgi:hypothetical protein